MRFSYSKLNVFFTCPLQFKFKYLDKDKEEEVTDSYSTYLGRGVHDALHKLYLNKDKDLIWLEKIWAEIAEEQIEEANKKAPDVFKEEKTVTIFKNHGRKILRNFYSDNEGAFKQEEHNSLALEKFFAVDFKDFTLSGVIDKVEKIGSEIYVVDYKTGAPLAQEEVDKNLQLTFYAIACRKAGLPLSKLNFCLHYVKDGVKVFTNRTIEDVKNLYKYLTEVKTKIDNEEFEATPSKTACRYCGFKKYCPAYTEDSDNE